MESLRGRAASAEDGRVSRNSENVLKAIQCELKKCSRLIYNSLAEHELDKLVERSRHEHRANIFHSTPQQVEWLLARKLLETSFALVMISSDVNSVDIARTVLPPPARRGVASE